jgi:hypothetical protein
MWNTDPVIVVLCLMALAGFLACVCVLQALEMGALRRRFEPEHHNGLDPYITRALELSRQKKPQAKA